MSSPDDSGIPSRDNGGAATPALMTVRVRDRAAESWGHGLTSPVVREVAISASCPRCGGPRGPKRALPSYDDGARYSVDVWDNPCGHRDMYEAVLAEALMLQARELPEHIIEFPIGGGAGDAILHHGECPLEDYCMALPAATHALRAGASRPPGRYTLRVDDRGDAVIGDEPIAAQAVEDSGVCGG